MRRWRYWSSFLLCITKMAEPYSPSEQARFYPAPTGTGQQPARLSASYFDNGVTPPIPNQGHGKTDRDELLSPRSLPSNENKQKETINKLQGSIREVQKQMEDNILVLAQRGENLERLQDRTDSLSIQSKAFNRQASSTRRKMWFKNMKIVLFSPKADSRWSCSLHGPPVDRPVLSTDLQ
ncbi:synaptobrevin-domain-containing protein [Naematelia encephala]|uniref:Synaptobrevin-domain-containing protein n=1 Tax=Naematelia encephala TaxID=71784 RepID=A0A1Y2B5X0_9TREE|nr:synaptobrevin-domain-containing protein [Naematelia encephala]